MICPLCQSANAAQSPRCRACGAPLKSRASDAATAPDALLAGTLLAGTYAVETVLGQGGFGITYACHDQMLDRRVAVKEFFPSGCRRSDAEVQASRGLSDANFREARAQFLAEARTLARCHHVGIVGVHAAFEANSTAYMVMELLSGNTLGQLLSARGGAMNEAEAVGITERVGEALQFVHEQNLLHRDIKPDNIIVCDDGRVMLIDFGTARETIAGQVQGQTVVVTPGYAPLEQYARQAKRGPFTDVYSLAATLYHLLSGQMPPAASDRALGVQLRPLRESKPHLSPSVAVAVETALQMEIARRPQSVREFLSLLYTPVEAEPLHPQLAKLPDDDKFDSDDEIPAAMRPDALRARQQQWPLGLSSVDPQPVKLAPPRAFSSAAQPSQAKPPASPPAPASLPHNSSGGVSVRRANDPDVSGSGSWWGFAVFVAFIGFLVLMNSGGQKATVTPSEPQIGVRSLPSSSLSDDFQSRMKQTADNRAENERAWNALRALPPVSTQILPGGSTNSQKDSDSKREYFTRGYGVKFSPDGKRLAYIDSQSVLRVVSVPDRVVVRSLRLDKNHTSVEPMFSSDNNILAVTQTSKLDSKQREPINRVEAWNLRTGNRLGTFKADAADDELSVWGVLNNGQLLLKIETSGDSESKVFLWNARTGERAKTSLGRFYDSAIGVVSPDEKQFVGAYSSGVYWLNFKDGKKKSTYYSTLTWGDQYERFASKYENMMSKPSANDLKRKLDVKGLRFSPNGNWLASRDDAEITVFDEKARAVKALQIYYGEKEFAISPDGKWLAASSNFPMSRERLLLWNVKTGQEARLVSPSGYLRNFSFSPDGKKLYGVFTNDGKPQFVTWEVNPKIAQTPRLFARTQDASFDSTFTTRKINDIVVSQNAQKIAVPTVVSTEIHYFDGRFSRSLNESDALATAFSPDGKLLAVRGESGVRLWNASDGKLMQQLAKVETTSAENERDGNARSMAFSADNKLLAFARSRGDKAVVELWNVAGAPRLLGTLNQQEPLNALTFSPDGKGLICGGAKGALQWFDVKTRELKSQDKTGEPIFDIVFAARNLVVMGESNSTLYQVPASSVNPLQKAAKTKLEAEFNSGRDVYTPATISPDGKLLATAQGYKDFQIWELPSGRKLQSLKNGQNSASTQTCALSFSADSTEVTSIWRQAGRQAVTVSTYRREQAE